MVSHGIRIYRQGRSGESQRLPTFHRGIRHCGGAGKLGNLVRFYCGVSSFAAALSVFGELLQPFSSTPWIGWIFPYLSFWRVLLGTIGFAALCAFCVYVFTHLKWDFGIQGYDWRKSLRTIHFNDLWMTFYDTELDPNVAYARHAISIDENRANFKRVHWSSVKEAQRDPSGIQWFEQVCSREIIRTSAGVIRRTRAGCPTSAWNGWRFGRPPSRMD